jgi:hypothetical protein
VAVLGKQYPASFADLQQPIGVLGVVGEVIGVNFHSGADGAQRLRNVVSAKITIQKERGRRARRL